jgi:hypothetical protein
MSENMTREEQIAAAQAAQASVEAEGHFASGLDEVKQLVEEEGNSNAETTVSEIDGVFDEAKAEADKKIKWEVDEKLNQVDDGDEIDQREANKGQPLNVEVMKEIIRTGGNPLETFDPLAGFAPAVDEESRQTHTNKYYQIHPIPQGTGKNKTVKVINGVKQYRPKIAHGAFTYFFNQKAVQDALAGIFYDAASKYVYDMFLNPRINKMVENKHYGRKMPAVALDRPFGISFAAIETLTGVSFEEFLHELLRKGWFKKGTSVSGFDIGAVCETDANRKKILVVTGDAIAGWKPAMFPHLMTTVAIFKRIGKIVRDGFKYKGQPPQSTALRIVIEAIAHYTKKYQAKMRQIDGIRKQVEAGTLPPEAMTELKEEHYKICEEQLKWWGLVTCGLNGLADERQKAEEEKMAKQAKTQSIDEMDDDLEFLEI